MSEVFKNAKAALTTSGGTIYTCPAETTAIVLLAQVANIDGTDEANADVAWTDASDSDTSVALVQDAPIPAGGALNVIGGKLVLEAGDSITAKASVDNDLEMSVSALEVS